MKISVTPELERFVAEQVASGRYSSASEVVRDALRLLEESNQLQPPPCEQEFSQPPTSARNSGAKVGSEVVSDPAKNGNPDAERWLHEDVVPVYDRMQASPERAIPAEEVFRAIRRRHAEQRNRSS